MKFYAPIKLSENMRRTPEGFLLCLGVAIARTGEMVYGPGETPIDVGPNGKVIISRDEKEVFSEATIASFSGKPVTIRHPEEDVTPDNWATLAKGSIFNIRPGTEKDENGELPLLSDVLIMDKDAIVMVEERGLREVSCGYDAEYVQTEPGRGFQEKIIGNHLALVENGRAGTAYAIRDHQEQKGLDDMKTRDEKAASKKKDKKGLIAKIFSRAQDEATKVLDEESVEEAVVGDEDPKKKEEKPTYDELAKMCDALKGEVAELKKGKDELKKSPDGAEVEDEESEEGEGKDEDPMVSVMARLDALEAKIEKVIKAENAEAEEMSAGDEEESTEEVVEEKTDDEEEDTAHMTGDTASRAEILAPGIKLTKDVKVKAINQAYATKDGQAAIHRFTGGKKPDLTKPNNVEMIFVGASEILKASRGADLASTRKAGARDGAPGKLPITPEDMNAKMAAFYTKK